MPVLSRSKIEYLERGYNWYQGCAGGCTYCYAWGAARRFGTLAGEWETPERRPGYEQPVTKMRDYLKQHRIVTPLMLSTSHDPAFNTTAATETAGILHALHEAEQDAGVLVLTKFPNRLLAALDGQPFRGFFGASITSLFPSKWEPGAEPGPQRLAGLQRAAEQYKTWVSAEPIQPGQAVLPLLEAVGFADWVVWGKMNVRSSRMDAELRAWSASRHWVDEVRASQEWAQRTPRATSIRPIKGGFWIKNETRRLLPQRRFTDARRADKAQDRPGTLAAHGLIALCLFQFLSTL